MNGSADRAFVRANLREQSTLEPRYGQTLLRARPMGRGSKGVVASSDDVPGLATEADTTEALVQKLKTLIPELLDLNGRTPSKPIAFELLTRRFELAA